MSFKGRGKTGTPLQPAGAFWRGVQVTAPRPAWFRNADGKPPSIRKQQSGYLKRNSAKDVTLPKLKFMGDE